MILQRPAWFDLKTSGEFLDRQNLLFAAGVFLALSWLVPNHETPWLTFHSETLAAIGAIFLVLFAAVLGPREARHGLPTSVFVLLACAAIPWIQWALGQISYRGDALLASMYLGCAALVMWAGFIASGDRSHTVSSMLAMSSIWSAILSTGAALYQKLHLVEAGAFILDLSFDDRATANFGQANHLATLLMLGLASTAWLRHQRKIGTGCAGLAAAFLVLGLALTGSRQPIVGVCLLAVWSLRARSLRDAGRGPRLAFGALVTWYLVAYFGANQLLGAMFGSPLAQSTRLQPGLRPLMWDQFAHAIANAPWLGYGWQGGLTAQAAIAIQTPGLEFTQYAHNILIDLVVWNGLPLGLLLIAALLAWYWRTGRTVREQGGWFEFAIFNFVFAHALLEYPVAYTFFLIPAALAAGMLEGRKQSPAMSMPRWCLPAISAIFVGALVVVVDDYLALAEERRELITWKIRLGGDHPVPATPTPLILDQLAASIEWMRNVASPAMPTGQIEAQTRLSRRYPTVAILTRTVVVLGLNDQTAAAYAELLRLRGLHGQKYYDMAVHEVRGLAETTEPTLERLVATIDENASKLVPLPDQAEEAVGHRFR